MIESRTLMFNKAHIHYSISKEQHPDCILMLHAAFADRHMFEEQMSAFMSKYRVIAIDMPGHGDTVTKGSSVTIKHMPDIIKRLLRENEINACHLVGVSLGSLIAQAYADRCPEQVRSVTIVGGYSIHKANEQLIKAQRKEGLRWLLYILFSMKRFRSYVTAVSCHTEQGRAIFTAAINRFNRSSFAAMSGLDRLFVPRETSMTYPLHIMYGEHDLPLAAEAAVNLHKLEPKSELTKLQGAGHCANLDEPLLFNDKVERFLNTVG
ncbi:alpha/beta fold hydrolase [Paenibacillus terricola]|nr:alpha/beta hydrolase [Paenibacillus terricola]